MKPTADRATVDCSPFVTVSSSGSTITLTAAQTGENTNITLSGGSSTSQPGLFSHASFAVAVASGTGTQIYTLSVPVVTYYTYDLLGNLLQAVHQGSPDQTRTYTYDALSRVLTAKVPEANVNSQVGTSTFYYTASGGGLCSGDASAVCRRVDPRSITTTYTYNDPLNRLTQVSYTDGTPTVTYSYDSGTNGKGQRTGMTDGSGNTAWGYDAVGEVITEQRTIAGITKTMSYGYAGDGTLNSITYPSGRKVNYAVGNAERLLSATDTNGSQYAAIASYSPPGGLSAVIYGQVSGAGGTKQLMGYNNRLEPCRNTATTTTTASFTNPCTDAKPSGSILDLQSRYVDPNGHNNGNVASITNNIDSGRTESATYDGLNRLLSAVTQATSGADCWGQSFGVDPVANLTAITVTQCTGGSLSASTDGYNHFTNSPYSYDNAGNMTNDGANSYTYDAENRIKAGGGVTYTYDGNGVRVEKSNGTLYWRSITGDVLAETDLSGNTKNEYVYFAGERIAWINAGNTYYLYTDAVGTIRTIAQANGTTCYDADFTPYGQEIAHTSSCPATYNYKFTGYERDLETGLDYAFARYYSSRLGRFLSTDPLGGGTDDPQSLNRYAYVANNPRNAIDPSGAQMCQYWETTYINGVQNGPPKPTSIGPCLWSPQEQMMLDLLLDGLRNESGGGGPDPQAQIKAARDRAVKLLKNPKSKCAAFVASLLKRVGATATLAQFMEDLSTNVKFIPTPQGDPMGKEGYDAHVDDVGESAIVHVDQPGAYNIAGTFVHEVFHTIYIGATDFDLAKTAGGPFRKPTPADDAIHFNSDSASKQFGKFCNSESSQ